MSPRVRRIFLITATALVAWFLCVVLLWAVRPLSDAVPIGIDYSSADPADWKQFSQDVDCNSLFAGDAREAGPLPSLPIQPVGKPELTYSREPCSAVQRDARIVFGLNTTFVLVALGGLALVAKRLGSQPPPPPAIAASAPPPGATTLMG